MVIIMENNIKLLLKIYYMIENEKFVQETCCDELGVTDKSIIDEVVNDSNAKQAEIIKDSIEYKNFVRQYFKDRDNVSFKEIFDCLRKYKYETLNYLLNIIKEELDLYYVYNFNDIVEMINDNFKYAIENKQKSKKHKTISLSELTDLLNEFLVDFDKTEEIGNLFADFVNRGKLILEQKTGSKDRLTGNYNPYRNEITIGYDGTVLDFIKIVHEFTHYLIDYYNSDDYLLIEFPSEYMENLAAAFLVKKGYAESIQELLDFRNTDSITISSYELDILRTYFNKGEVNKDDMTRIAKEYKEGTMNTFKMLQELVDVPEGIQQLIEENNKVDDELIINDLMDSFIAKNYFDTRNITDDLDYSMGRYFTRHANFDLSTKEGYEASCKAIKKIIKKYDSYTIDDIEKELGIKEEKNKIRALF